MTSPGSQPTRDWGLDPDLEERALELFAAVVPLPDAERNAALDAACAGNARLRAAIVGLLRDHDAPPPILSRLLQGDGGLGSGPLRPGAQLGPYRIVDVIGRGGMGIVYRALQDRPRRSVALKVMSLGIGQPEALRRFEREVEVLGLLQHPGICSIHGAGAIDLGTGLGEVPYFAMEWIDGLPLTEFASSRRLDVAARCELVAQVCDAVQHAHERDVVHRDLKPGNILVGDGAGQGPVARVLDFGIARAIHSDAPAPGFDTRTGLLLGTVHYMSPEQLGANARNIDARSDVYSLGAILFELLTGRLPLMLDGLPLGAVCDVVARQEPPSLAQIDRRLAGDLAVITAKALQKDREDRYQSAGELAADLRRHLRHAPILARPLTATYQLRKFARRNRALVGSVAAALVVMAAGLVALGILASHNKSLANHEREAREQLRGSLYRSQMRLGSDLLDRPGGVSRLRAILGAWVPAAGETDLRGFEWHLLDAAANRELQILPTATAPQELIWPESARLVAVAAAGLTEQDAADGHVRRGFTAPAGLQGLFAASADGRILVEPLAATELRTVELATGASIATFSSGDPFETCALSADGALLATAILRRGIAIWDARTGQRRAELPIRSLGGMAFSPSGDRFAAAIDQVDVPVSIWRTDDFARPPMALRRTGNDPVARLRFSPDGSRIATTGSAGWLRVWRTGDGTCAYEFEHPDELRGCAFSRDGAILAVGCRDYGAHLHDLESGTHRVLTGHGAIVDDVAWRADGERLATIGDDATIRIWDPADRGVERRLQLPTTQTATLGQLTWPDADRVAIHICYSQTTTWHLDTNTVDGAYTFGPPGSHYRWTMANALLERLADPAGPAARTLDLREACLLAASPDGVRLALASANRRSLQIWDGARLATLPGAPFLDVRGFAWIDAQRLLVVDGRDAIREIDATNGAELAVRPIPECTLTIAVAADGSRAAIGCVDQAVRVLPAHGEGATLELRGHTNHVEAVAFAPDGRRLASGARDRTVKVWDLAAASEVASYAVDAPVIALAWRSDGTGLAALCAQGEVRVWDARPKRPK